MAKVIVYVKHYLTPEGIIFFQNEWFPSVFDIISQQKGFVSITNQIEGPCVSIKLRFADQETFDAWVEHPSHDRLVAALDGYRDRDYWEAVKTDNEEVSPSELSWEVYH